MATRCTVLILHGTYCAYRPLLAFAYPSDLVTSLALPLRPTKLAREIRRAHPTALPCPAVLACSCPRPSLTCRRARGTSRVGLFNTRCHCFFGPLSYIDRLFYSSKLHSHRGCSALSPHRRWCSVMLIVAFIAGLCPPCLLFCHWQLLSDRLPSSLLSGCSLPSHWGCFSQQQLQVHAAHTTPTALPYYLCQIVSFTCPSRLPADCAHEVVSVKALLRYVRGFYLLLPCCRELSASPAMKSSSWPPLSY